MMNGMLGDFPTAHIAFTTRPSDTWLVVSIVSAMVAYIVWRRTVSMTRPPRPIEIGESRPRGDGQGGLEPPAVVGVLTNGYEVPLSAVTATVLDLARRGWVRLATSDSGELVVFVRGHGRSGDALRPFEQQVLNHLTARSFDGVTSAATLAATRDRLNRRWMRRFERDVVRAARERNLTRERFTPLAVAPAGAVTAIGLIIAWLALRAGDDQASVAESAIPRAIWVAATLILITVAYRVVTSALAATEYPTEAGEGRAGQWLGYRRRLAQAIPESASVVTSDEQQLALAYATVMGVTTQVIEQVAVTREDDRQAWSEAGGLPHVVRVRYPFRPGYGRNPLMLAALGAVVLLVSQVIQRFLHRVADGQALEGLVGTFPDHTERVESIVGIVGDVVWIPTIWALWAIVSGLLDSVIVSDRTGTVVRVRRPVDVVPARRLLAPLAERDRFSVYLAVDDGRRRSVTAWVANERTAVPEGAHASVSATRMLGHVRSSAPVGTSTRAVAR